MADTADLKSASSWERSVGSSPTAPTYFAIKKKGCTMIKWPITYTDYNGEEHTEDFYFNLSKAEVIEMDIMRNGAYGAYLQNMVANRDGEKIATEFKKIIQKSYGVKSPDGRRFIKNQEVLDAFIQSEAYSELYMQLATEPGAAEKFVEGVLPKVEGKAPVPENMRLS